MRLAPILPVIVGLAGLAACKNDNQIQRRSETDLFYQEPTDQVDILWVIDNSPSMADEQAEVAAGFQSFIANIEETGLDFHVGVVTTDTDNPDENGKLVGLDASGPTIISDEIPDYVAVFGELVQVGVDGSDKERGIEAGYKALSEPLRSGYNEGFLRPGANLSVIYVSDENDCTDRGALSGDDSTSACYDNVDSLVSLKVLTDEYESLKVDGERILVSAIVGPEIVADCDGAKPGFRYLGMAESFGGIEGSICDEDFAGIMSDLGLQVSGVLTTFQLTWPAVEETLEVYVDDDLVDGDPASGWTYDEEYWILRFDGSFVPPRGSVITVRYEVAAGSGAQQG